MKTRKFIQTVIAVFVMSVVTAFGQLSYNFTTIAGTAGVSGSADGTNGAAQFGRVPRVQVHNGGPRIAADSSGNLYVADEYNDTIRMLTPMGTNWVVTTIAGLAGNIGSADGTNGNAQFYRPVGIAVDSSGNLYVADEYNDTIRMLTPMGTNWVVTTIAGLAGNYGSADGTNGNAQFHQPSDIALDSSGNLYVADEYNDTIRMLTPMGTNWVVTTIAGLAGNIGSADGTNGNAQFYRPVGIAVDSSGNLYVADEYNDTIRMLTPMGTNWVVTTIAGLAGNNGSADGTNGNAQFNDPCGIAVDSGGNVYVADTFNDTIRMLTPMGTNWVVNTIGGLAKTPGSTDGIGTNALFGYPGGVAVDNAGNIYVADWFNATIREGTSQIQPVINLQPTNSIVLAGSNVVLSVSASGFPTLTYQWQNSQGTITNATNANFTISNAQPTNADNYLVIVFRIPTVQ